MALEPGMERTDEFTVEGPLVTDVGGTIGMSVLSTPGMIAMMERTASVLSFENLPDGKATVGFEVCIKHVAGAMEGATCTARTTLREVADERKLRFDVEVTEGELDTARERRDDVGAALKRAFPGSRVYVNGSVAHGDALTPLTDVDVGVVVPDPGGEYGPGAWLGILRGEAAARRRHRTTRRHKPKRRVAIGPTTPLTTEASKKP